MGLATLHVGLAESRPTPPYVLNSWGAKVEYGARSIRQYLPLCAKMYNHRELCVIIETVCQHRE